MTVLTFHGGVNEIGGNKILLEDKDTKIFLDFGKGFTSLEKYFEEYLAPRSSNGILDFITMGLVPDIPGIYRDDLMFKAGREIKEPEVGAVLVSHAHADHVDYVSFLHRDIPIYMGQTTHNMIKAIQERSSGAIDREILEFKLAGTKRGDPKIARKINEFRSGNKFEIGSLEIEPIHVDHSIPGAYGFIIYTSEGPVVYTGDLRRHGSQPQMTEEFVQKAKEVKPIALIAEGTRIKDPPTNENEQMVYDESNKLTADTSNLIFADFNFKDVDRVRTFYNVAKANNRKLVVKIRDCYFLKYMSQDPKLGIPNWDDENIVIYKAKYRSGTYSDSDYYGEDRVFATSPNAMTASEIAKHPNKYICALGFFSFNALIDMKPKPGTVYIHSASEAYNEEQVLSTKRLHNWIEKFQMEHHQIHCSGHAKGTDLLNMVKEIDAKMLFPIHTEYPTEYVRVTNKINIVEQGKRYEI
ncbi:MBL fold metallo-hydrolase [Nitrosopumilus sp. b1]|uniref:MBL fold metallo-hydrolase n=1 Tax=Nitrosopumilus sp. b1 TaxID=2109907 RepID=UPI0015F62F0D|nr:MBL fold metallo-hydrolase [Nitrosopumilus sp. b1]KAF6243631.1 MBL fold metallo-hydrolase [Nitrosopumilus sp. b1]